MRMIIRYYQSGGGLDGGNGKREGADAMQNDFFFNGISMWI